MDANGYFGLWRKMFTSEIWRMPPIYLKVWLWILGHVQWKLYEAKTPTRYVVFILPGQKITSLSEIAHGVVWEEWGVEKIPNKKTIATILEWLKDRGQINVESNNKHTFINVINWHTYQGIEFVKVTHDGSHFTRTTDTNKKEYKEKKEKNKSLEVCKQTLSPDGEKTNVPYQQIVDLYHELLPICPKAKLTDVLKKKIRVRYHNGMAGVAAWREYFIKVSMSDFLTGKAHTYFLVNLPWLVGPENMTKVQNGQYDNRGAGIRVNEKNLRTIDATKRFIERGGDHDATDDSKGHDLVSSDFWQRG